MDMATREIVAGPEIVSRGFVYIKNSDELMENIRFALSDTMEAIREKNISEWSTIKKMIVTDLSNYVWHEMGRSPMILPIIQEV